MNATILLIYRVSACLGLVCGTILLTQVTFKVVDKKICPNGRRQPVISYFPASSDYCDLVKLQYHHHHVKLIITLIYFHTTRKYENS